MVLPITSLPKIQAPTYELKLPSNGKEILIRPFLVREEKLLLMAAESKDEQEIIRTTKQVINNCLVSGEVDVEKLPFFDIDYLFIALRAKSVGESLDLKFNCQAVQPDGDICGNAFDVKIDITNVELLQKKDVEKDINIAPSIRIKMKYPTYSLMKAISMEDIPIERKIVVITNCIEQIIEKDKVYTQKDFTKTELKNFVEGMTQEQFKKLEYFVDNFPTFAINAKSKCGKCGFEHNIQYDDFTSFFF